MARNSLILDRFLRFLGRSVLFRGDDLRTQSRSYLCGGLWVLRTALRWTNIGSHRGTHALLQSSRRKPKTKQVVITKRRICQKRGRRVFFVDFSCLWPMFALGKRPQMLICFSLRFSLSPWFGCGSKPVWYLFRGCHATVVYLCLILVICIFFALQYLYKVFSFSWPSFFARPTALFASINWWCNIVELQVDQKIRLKKLLGGLRWHYSVDW